MAELAKCPSCKRMKPKEDIDSFFMCLTCDKIIANANEEMIEHAREEIEMQEQIDLYPIR